MWSRVHTINLDRVFIVQPAKYTGRMLVLVFQEAVHEQV